MHDAEVQIEGRLTVACRDCITILQHLACCNQSTTQNEKLPLSNVTWNVYLIQIAHKQSHAPCQMSLCDSAGTASVLAAITSCSQVDTQTGGI